MHAPHSPRRAPTLFTSTAYLQALEDSGCASPASGWQAAHIVQDGGRLPCYEKAHSWGEFVFDFELARLWQARGRPYYPKLVSCVPFTPVPGPRLLAANSDARLLLARTLRERAANLGSSAHILFLSDDERELLRADGWIERAQRRHIWHAGAGGDFEDFLARLSSKHRKNLRAERRKLSGFGFEWRSGDTFTAAEWRRIFALYASTYEIRGQSPYLNLDCLQQWARDFGAAMPFCLAIREHRIVAMAFFFQDGDTLYGRHWGADAQYDSLHFELCYYQGIERCLGEGLAHFDAGVQGEHKRHRGFTAELAYSMHWFDDPELMPLIARAYAREAALLRAQDGQPDDAQ